MAERLLGLAESKHDVGPGPVTPCLVLRAFPRRQRPLPGHYPSLSGQKDPVSLWWVCCC